MSADLNAWVVNAVRTVRVWDSRQTYLPVRFPSTCTPSLSYNNVHTTKSHAANNMQGRVITHAPRLGNNIPKQISRHTFCVAGHTSKAFLGIRRNKTGCRSGGTLAHPASFSGHRVGQRRAAMPNGPVDVSYLDCESILFDITIYMSINTAISRQALCFAWLGMQKIAPLD